MSTQETTVINPALSLYGITEEIQKLEVMLIDEQGEITEESENLTARVNELLSNKTDGCVGFVDQQKDLITAAKSRIAHLRDFISVRENSLTRFNEYVKTCLEQSGRDSFQGKLYQVKLRKPSKVLVIEDDGNVPPEFVTIETITKINKTDLKKAIKAGTEIKGVTLADGKVSVMFSTLKS